MMKEVHGGNIYKYDHSVFDFSANLNPLGMPEAVKQAVIRNIDSCACYPDPFNRELSAAISGFHGVAPERICCGNGAADLIFRIPLALRPKKALIVSPTFSEYEQALLVSGCKVVHHLLKEKNGFYPDASMLDAIDETVDMVFLCNPNNPTGIPVQKELILAAAKTCRQAGAMLVVDECFTSFLDEEEKYSVMDQIEQLPNVIILKAFTKIYAMAGLRLGYCICGDSACAEKIAETLQPWAVSTAASKAGIAALSLDGFIEETKAYVSKNRRYLVDGLRELGFRVYDTEANYVLFRSEQELSGPLAAFDIAIRSCSNYLTLDEHYYRIAVRTEVENTYLLRCLAKIAGVAEERNEE